MPEGLIKFLPPAFRGQFIPARYGQDHRFIHPGCIFAEKLVLENGPPTLPTSLKLRWSKKASEDKSRVAFPVFTEQVHLSLMISEVLGSSKKKLD